MQLESKKTRVISINLTSRELIDSGSDEGRQLNDQLMLMNKRWDSVCAHATRLQSELQDALMQCQEFHHTVHDLLLWLEGIELKIQQCEPIKLANDEAALWTILRKLRVCALFVCVTGSTVCTVSFWTDVLRDFCQSVHIVSVIANLSRFTSKMLEKVMLCDLLIVTITDDKDIKHLNFCLSITASTVYQ